MHNQYRAGFAACLSVMESQNKFVGFWSFISICNQIKVDVKQKRNPFFDEGAFIFGLDRNSSLVPYTDHLCFTVDKCAGVMCDIQSNDNVTLVVAKSFSNCKH